MASISNPSEEDARLRARIADACHLCERRSCPRFVGFLDEHCQAVARAVLRETGQSNTAFFGGYPDAERVMLGVFPDFMEADTALFPFVAMRFSYRPSAALTHRDFLGTLMANGVKRETVGDIVCKQGQTVVFIAEEVAPFLAENIRKVGGEGVSVEYPYTEPVAVERAFRELTDTVASPRLDSVVKAAARISREEAARRIEGGFVSLNHMPCESVSASVAEGDVLSVRGHGRFVVDAVGPQTKKGRYVLKLRQYL